MLAFGSRSCQMTKREFIENRDAALRQARIFAVPALVLYFGVMVGAFRLCELLVPHWQGKGGRMLAMVVFVASPLGAFTALLHWIKRRRLLRFGLLCPFCGKPLMEWQARLRWRRDAAGTVVPACSTSMGLLFRVP